MKNFLFCNLLPREPPKVTKLINLIIFKSETFIFNNTEHSFDRIKIGRKYVINNSKLRDQLFRIPSFHSKSL